MRHYRIAFLITLIVAACLAATLGYIWFHPRVTPAPNGRAASAGGSQSPAAATPAEPKLVPIQLTPQRMQSIGVRIGVVEFKPVHDEIRTVGNVEVDEARVAHVQVRFSGWIKTVFADKTYQLLRKGQPLFTIYSPDVVATEEEYLLARENRNLLAQSSVPGVASGAVLLLGATVARLKQWDIPEREIAELEKTGQIRREMVIDSTVTGSITERNAFPNMYVQPGTNLYTVADLSTVWVYAEVPQNDIGRVKVGDSATVTVDSYAGRIFRGRISFISPQLDQATRTARVRLEISNAGFKLSLGMFVNVRLDLPLGRQLTVPASAVYQSGTRQIAFVDRGNGYLEPREIEVGARVGDDFIVSKGLSEGDRVVTSANFLVDSESQLQAALGSFAPPPPGAGAAAAMNTPQAQASIEYSSRPSPPHKGGNTFHVKLIGPDGAPVTGAQVTVTLYMAAMPSMGMAAMRTVATLGEKGGGVYEGPGQLDSGGTWQVTVVAAKNGQTVAQKQFSVSAEGGM